MQNLTERVFHLNPPGGLFDETVIRNLYPEKSEGARRLLVHRATTAKEVIRIRPGVFCLAERYRQSQLHPFVLAGRLHSPSHVSLESALSHHGLIPEAVFQVASVTSQRSRQFQTPLGNFTFQRVPSNQPRAGVQSLPVSKDSWAFVATPLRAIGDLVYTKKTITWSKDGIRFLEESMRIDLDELKSFGFDQARTIIDSFRNQRTRVYLTGLCQEMNHDP